MAFVLISLPIFTATAPNKLPMLKDLLLEEQFFLAVVIAVWILFASGAGTHFDQKKKKTNVIALILTVFLILSANLAFHVRNLYILQSVETEAHPNVVYRPQTGPNKCMIKLPISISFCCSNLNVFSNTQIIFLIGH